MCTKKKKAHKRESNKRKNIRKGRRKFKKRIQNKRENPFVSGKEPLSVQSQEEGGLTLGLHPKSVGIEECHDHSFASLATKSTLLFSPSIPVEKKEKRRSGE